MCSGVEERRHVSGRNPTQFPGRRLRHVLGGSRHDRAEPVRTASCQCPRWVESSWRWLTHGWVLAHRVLLSWFHVRLKINIIVMVSNAVTTCLLFWMVSCWVLKNRRSSPPYLLCGLRLTSYLSKIPFGKDLKPLRERLEISMVVALLICAFMNKLGKLVHSFFRWGSLEENDCRHWCNNMCVENGRYGHTPIRSDTSVRVYTTADTDTSTPCVGVPATCNIRPGRSLRQRSS